MKTSNLEARSSIVRWIPLSCMLVLVLVFVVAVLPLPSWLRKKPVDPFVELKSVESALACVYRPASRITLEYIAGDPYLRIWILNDRNSNGLSEDAASARQVAALTRATLWDKNRYKGYEVLFVHEASGPKSETEHQRPYTYPPPEGRFYIDPPDILLKDLPPPATCEGKQRRGESSDGRLTRSIERTEPAASHPVRRSSH